MTVGLEFLWGIIVILIGSRSNFIAFVRLFVICWIL